MKLKFVTALMVILALSVSAFATPTTVVPKSSSETPVQVGAIAVDSGNGNQVANLAENVILFFQNSAANGASTATVTITAQTTTQNIPGYGPVTKSNITQTLGGGSTYYIGPLPAQAFNDANGNVQITYSGAVPSLLLISPVTSTKLLKIP